MKINIIPYDKNWAREFERLKAELSVILGEINPGIEHIGSTSVPGLAAKNVIDILVGLEKSSQFDFVTNELAQNDRYIYYKAFEKGLPNRRLFVRLKDGASSAEFEKVFLHQEKIPHEAIQKNRLANVHVVEKESSEWLRHIAFREYLIAHEEVRLEYAEIKAALSQKIWKHGMEYNEGKDSFIKREEKKAVEWYLSCRK
ncbi:GrpB family protein [Aquiflexum sp.]|uniref:GrpB family protein n=1 Tax=Aquiflexum sp. TaxID=1872584 RepID=UPI003593E3B7